MTSPSDHGVVLYIAVGDRPGRAIGTTRTTADVPDLLRAIAAQWDTQRSIGAPDPGTYGEGTGCSADC